MLRGRVRGAGAAREDVPGVGGIYDERSMNMDTTTMETPSGFACSPRGYEQLAAMSAVKGSPIAKFFERQSHAAAVALERERFTARRVIDQHRRDAAAEYERAKDEQDVEAMRLVVVDGHAVARMMAGLR
jgi:hypothetical protein